VIIFNITNLVVKYIKKEKLVMMEVNGVNLKNFEKLINEKISDDLKKKYVINYFENMLKKENKKEREEEQKEEDPIVSGVNKELMKNFKLLANIIRQTQNPEMKVDLKKIEKLINEKIPETLKKNAPADYYELYTDFKSEYEKFRDFILYDQLIGKNIISLGGGFSSGKSSFLNALNGESALPEDTDPSTSVPTYIVNGEKYKVLGINIFDTKVEIQTKEIRKIAHGFGEIEDDDGNIITENTTLGHVLESVFLSTPKQKYLNVAFLDTPGYSKPDDEKYSAKTDEQIARGQLNSSNFILWFVQADSGTITEEDIKFLNTLRKDIPKLIILNKADKKPENDLKKIVEKIKSTLDIKGIRYVDVLMFSNTEPEGYDSHKIKAQIESWDKKVYESNFARNFKVLFVKCKVFYEKEIVEESRRLNRLNKARTLTDDDIVEECLDSLIVEIKKNIAMLKSINEKLKEIQNEFFTEIKYIGDIVGIQMPEPSEIDLIQDKIQNPMQIIEKYKKKKGIKTNHNLFEIIQNAFCDINVNINNQAGGSKYKNELFGIIKNNCDIKNDEIHFNDILKTSEEYKKLLENM